MQLATGNLDIDTSTAEWIVGSDEVGFGSWAGPLCVVALALPRDWQDPWGVTDSKKLSKTKRKKITDAVLAQPPAYSQVWVGSEEIDEKGVWQCLLEAHRKALTSVLEFVPGKPLIVVDGFPNGAEAIGVPGAIGLPKADLLVPPVSLASIIAKTTRDALMAAFDSRYPGYDFGKHSGYGTQKHTEALNRLGPCPIHRKSYSPIARLLQGKQPTLDELTAEAEALGMY